MGSVKPFSSSELKFLNKYYSSSNKLPLTNYETNSRKKLWWKCPKCKHVERKSIYENITWFRSIKIPNKRYCLNCIRIKFPYLPKNASSKKLRMFSAAFDRNGSFKKHAEKSLLKEWDYEKNLVGPDRYSINSAYQVWWKCKNGHSYQRSIKAKRGKNRGVRCPKCIYFCTKTEARIFSELKLIDPRVKFREKLGGYECDIFLKSSNIAIEIDGYPWHANEEKIAFDKKKSKHIKSLGVTLLRLRERRCGRLHSTDTVFDECYGNISKLFKPYIRLLRKIHRLSKSKAVKKKVTEYLNKNSCFINEELFYELYNNSKNKGFDGKSAGDIHKEFSQQWGDKNNLPISNYPQGSNKKVWWKCKECNNEYRESVLARVTSWKLRYKNGGLKHARTSTSCPIHKPFAEVNKFNNIIAKYGKWILGAWDYKKNTKSPYKIKASKVRERFWVKCHICLNSYTKSVSSLSQFYRNYGVKHNSGIIECSKCHEDYHTKKSLNISKEKAKAVVCKRLKEIISSESKASPICDLELGKKLYKEGLFTLNPAHLTHTKKHVFKDSYIRRLAIVHRKLAGIKSANKRRKELSVYDVYGERILEIWDNKKNKQSVYDYSYYGCQKRRVWIKCPNGCSSNSHIQGVFNSLNATVDGKFKRGIRCKVCNKAFSQSRNIVDLQKNIIDIINNESEPLSDMDIIKILIKRNVSSVNGNGHVSLNVLQRMRLNLGIPNSYERKRFFDKGEKIEYEYVQ